ncbi:hypothetical protein [Pontibacillus marinus]|uniref:Uncharacterized protein n=1 Tax=Pontibacillus marinus BH030004 = DSM 16465 TaxID=1385511 RepID=A0A0A5HKJ1_9BACI|nr:hypothetical protein [Pontibacillus marinus]KGX84157.1 hypothetical protein N783_18850 [Pontibacillus marinus BH030004 = DSM 16465]
MSFKQTDINKGFVYKVQHIPTGEYVSESGVLESNIEFDQLAKFRNKEEAKYFINTFIKIGERDQPNNFKIVKHSTFLLDIDIPFMNDLRDTDFHSISISFKQKVKKFRRFKDKWMKK